MEKGQLKLPKCGKCSGKLFAQREVVESAGSIVVIKCVNCGWRMPPEQIEKLVAAARTVNKQATGGGYMAKKPVRVCLKCSDERPIIGRGLCGKCYFQEKSAGTIDENYPPTRKRGPNKPKVEKNVEQSTKAPMEQLADDLKDQEAASVPGRDLAAPMQPPVVDTSIMVYFGDRDLARFKDIVAAADRNRRSLGDEILFRLDRLDEVAA